MPLGFRAGICTAARKDMRGAVIGASSPSRAGTSPKPTRRSPSRMSSMHKPPHRGKTFRDDVLPSLGLTVTDVSVLLGVTRVPRHAQVG